MKPATWIGAALFAFWSVVPSMAQVATRPLDKVDAQKIIAQNCLMCHDEEMITQQRLPRAAWGNVLQKMHRWGSPISSEEIEPFADYLAGRYGPKAAVQETPRIPVEQSAGAKLPEASADQEGDAKQGAELFASHCATCHGSNGRGKVGPNLLSWLLSDNVHWQAVVRNGRRGMPTWKDQLKPSEVAAIRAWLLQEAKKVYQNP